MWGSRRKPPRGDSGDIVVIKKVDVQKDGKDGGHNGRKPQQSCFASLIQFVFCMSLGGVIFVTATFIAYTRGKTDAVPVNVFCSKADTPNAADKGPNSGAESAPTQVWPPEKSDQTDSQGPELGSKEKNGPFKVIVFCGRDDAMWGKPLEAWRDGSQYYRQSPGAGAARPNPAAGLPGGLAANTQDGMPSSCTGADQGDCINRWKMLSCSDKAQYWLKLGEAEVAIGRVEQAKKYFNEALRVGRACDTEYAGIAQKRLAALNLTCEYTPQSLARISRGVDQSGAGGNRGGAPIDLSARQQALKALGHYDGKVDGTYGASTRAAIQAFQRDYGFSETGDLDPIETVYLICAAAQNANDLTSINVLGIMYVTGLGVVQSTDIGMRWLKTAATRGNADALYNLALIYGTGVVLSSYRLCEIVESYDIADSYLRDAAAKGHRVALYLIQKYGPPLSAEQRWKHIRDELMDQVSFYRLRLENVGRGCEPN